MNKISKSGLTKYLKNTSWLFFEQIIRVLIGLIIGIYIASSFGPKKYGEYGYILSLMSIGTVICRLGLNNILIRDFITMDRTSTLTAMGTSFWIRLVFSLIYVIIMILLWSTGVLKSGVELPIILIGLLIQPFDVIDYYFQSQVKAKLSSIPKLTQVLVGSVCKVGVVVLDLGVIGLACAAVFDIFIQIFLLLLLFRKYNIGSFIFQIDVGYGKKMLSGSLFLLISSVSHIIYSRVDQVMLAQFLNFESVGQYAAAIRISDGFYMIGAIITTSIFPALVSAKSKDSNQYSQRLKLLYGSMIILALAFICACSILGSKVLIFIYGESYKTAGDIFIVLSYSIVFQYLNLAFGKWLVCENYHKLFLIKSLSGAILNCLLNIVLIPKYGVYGASYSTLITCVYTSVLFSILTKDLRSNFQNAIFGVNDSIRLFLKLLGGKINDRNFRSTSS